MRFPESSTFLQRLSHQVILLFALFSIALTQAYGGTAANSYLGSWDAQLVGEPWYDDSTNLTTFTYTMYGETYVAGDPTTGKDLSHWVIPLEDGMVVQDADVDLIGNPDWSVGFDPTTGVYGLKYDDGQPLDTTYTYTFTLVGEWSAADGYFYIKAGSNRVSDSVDEGVVETPSSTTVTNDSYSISGIAFVDINGNGLYDEFEPPLADVPVALDGTFAVFTDGDGGYSISGLTAGSYYVSVDLLGGGFVDTLTRYFNTSGMSSYQISLNADYGDVDFGYQMDVAAILADVDAEDGNGNGITLGGEGRTIGFWKHQLATLIRGKGKSQIDQHQIDALIDHINSFFLSEPFTIASYAGGYDVMAYKGSDAHSLMLKQLLATEFNMFHGMGLHDTGLMSVILMTAESYSHTHTLFTREELLLMKDLLDSINNMGH